MGGACAPRLHAGACGGPAICRMGRSRWRWDAQTIFTTASVMVLANGAILTAMGRELPASLRPAAIHWCLGTLLIAFGCVVFAFGGPFLHR